MTSATNTFRTAGADTLNKAFTPRIRAAFGRNDTPGTEIRGVIVAIEEEPDIDYITRAPKLHDDGTPAMVPILHVQTDGTTRPHGPGLRKAWIRTGLADALVAACLDAGVRNPVIGATVTIRFTGHGQPPAPGFAAPKHYDATYQPPTTGNNRQEVSQ